MIESIKRKIFDIEDALFEKRHGLQLSGIITKEDLVADNASRVHATAYHAVWCRNLRALIAEAKKTGLAFDNFIDIGSGKGKACFYAYKKQIFKQIIGVEFSKPLVEIAELNKAKLDKCNVNFVNSDACTYELPQGRNLVFMFNPFDDVILEGFLSFNLEHFKEFGSVIAYANDLQRRSLLKFGFETVFRDQVRSISIHRLP